MDGISALSIELKEDMGKVALRVRINDKWLDLLMDKYESISLANVLIQASSQLSSSVEVDHEAEYNRVHEEGTYMSAEQVQKARRSLELIDGGKAESGNLI